MSYVSVSDAASELAVSQARVRRMISAGQLRARKLGGRWLVDAGSLARPRPVSGRPMSVRMAWALMEMAEGREVSGLAATERRRLAEKLGILAEASDTEDASVRLAAWVRSRARRVVLHSNETDSLMADPRVHASGVSDVRARIAAPGVVEGYVMDSDFAAVRRDHLLRAAGEAPNVYLHVADRDIGGSVPRLAVVADLVEHAGPREVSQSVRMLVEVFA